jgi:hypothetical protein
VVLKGLSFVWIVTVSLGLSFSLLLLYDSKHAILPTLLFLSLYLTYLQAFFPIYLSDLGGSRHFGVLAGVVHAVGGVVGLLQYPLAMWAKGN